MSRVNAVEYLNRLKYLYEIIKSGNTGNPHNLCRRLNIAPRTLSNYIDELKSYGADVRFDRRRNTYYLNNHFTMKIQFEISATN